MRARYGKRAGDSGSATVELAIGLLSVSVFLVAGLAGISAITAQLRCVDAAREAARAEARGEPGVAAGQRSAPAGATITIGGNGNTVSARVAVVVYPLGGLLPSIPVSAEAVAAREPGEETP
ncbi:TadE family type IV pilus minor pilin [Longispora albida]|uniref:TadE family type IV pilus minor pilin n=1 Tax=Longispora albida TaxID=203523 RepID=UPI0003623555|nr:TadE family type IV pilus minor pilin [Longispora albida]